MIAKDLFRQAAAGPSVGRPVNCEESGPADARLREFREDLLTTLCGQTPHGGVEGEQHLSAQAAC